MIRRVVMLHVDSASLTYETCLDNNLKKMTKTSKILDYSGYQIIFGHVCI